MLVGEIACSLVLLAVTGLVGSSFNRLLSSARGLSTGPVTMAEANLSGPRYDAYTDTQAVVSRANRDRFIERSLASLKALPGVEDAAITSVMPLTGSMSVDGLNRPDQPLPPGKTPLVEKRLISPGYFRSLSIPLLAGRGFTEADRVNPHVMIVFNRTAQAVWPNENPIGRSVNQGGEISTIIGIAADARLDDPRTDVAMFYQPFWGHNYFFNPVFLIRGTGIAGPEVRKAIWSVDPQVAIPTLLPLHV